MKYTISEKGQMMKKRNTEISYDDDFRGKILNGVSKLAKVVGSTMGPMGSNVVIYQGGMIHCTKDGVTACRAVKSANNYEEIGISLIREASEKTNSTVGDGTSGTCVLAASIFANGLKHLSFGANGIKLRNGIVWAADRAVEFVKSKTKDISSKEEIREIAKISSNHSDEIADVLSDVFSKIGQNGTIKVDTGNTTSIESKIVEGMQFDRGYISPYFVTNDKMEADLENPFIFIVEKRITNVSEMIQPLQELAHTGRPILIIADGVEGDALSTIVFNKLKGLPICAVHSPSYGKNKSYMMQDIAILTGGKIVSEETGISLDRATPGSGILGTAKRVIVTKDSTTIIGGAGNPEELKKRIEQLKTQIYNSNDEYDLKKMRERLAKLDGGVGIISVGAKTESELSEKRDLVEDAFNACKAAIAGGVVPGGGKMLLEVRKYLNELLANEWTNDKGDDYTGAKIFVDSLDTPIRKILENAGLSPDLILSNLEKEENWKVGYDVIQAKNCDMIESGIVDPTNVVISEIENAASIAGLLLTTSASIVDEEEAVLPDRLAEGNMNVE